MAAKFSFKNVLANHGEKLGLGIIGLLALWGLSAAIWPTEPTVPGELQVNTEKTTQEILASTWPDEEREKFRTEDVRAMAGRIGRDVLEREQFATPVAWHEPLNPVREKQAAVVVLAPTFAEVSPISAPIAQRLEEEEEEDDDVEEDTSEEDNEELSEEMKRLREKYGQGGGRGENGNFGGLGGANPMDAALGSGLGMDGMMAFGMMPGLGRGGPGGAGRRGGLDEGELEDRMAGRGRGRGRGGRGAYGGTLGGDDEMMDDMMGGMMGGMGMMGMMGMNPNVTGAASELLPTADRDVDWFSGISVRMIVNLRRQRQEIARALHIRGVARTQQYVDYQQMHVERQELLNGVWTEWEEIKVEDLGDILTKALGSDVDIVSPAVTRAEITMPLPRRATGKWLPDEASHTRLEEFELDDDERDLINRMNVILSQEADEYRKRQPPEMKERKGFDQYIRDTNDLRGDALMNYQGDSGLMMDEMMDMIGGGRGFSQGRTGRGLNNRQEDFLKREFDRIEEEDATANERLLLVRFMDFTGVRGSTYRYRVRLEMYNPHYQAPAAELESPELSDMQTIVSDWSEPTSAAIVPMRYRYYVVKVDGRHGERRHVDLPTFYEGDGALPVMGQLDVHVGMPIGGSRKQRRVDLELMTLETGDVEYRTDDILCAAEQMPRLTPEEHPDLATELKALGRRHHPVGAVICVLQHNGDLALRRAGDDANSLTVDEDTVDFIMEEYENWRATGNELSGVLGGMEDFDDFEDADLTGFDLDQFSGMGGMGMGIGNSLDLTGVRNQRSAGRGRDGDRGRTRGR